MSESGNLTYLHKVLEQSVKDGKSFTHEESVIHGPRGLTIKYYYKKDDDVEKIVIYSKDGSFIMKTDKGEKTLSKDELIKELDSNKKLKFALAYVKTSKASLSRSIKRASKKTSKRTSKKTSKRTSKKTSKKPKMNSKRSSKKNKRSSKKV
jgi:topoisomerase IA-like protein